MFLFLFFSTYIYIGSLCSCFACTQVYQSPLGLWPTAAFHNCICIHQITFYHWNLLKSVKVLKSWKKTTEKFCRYWGLNPGLQLPIMSLMHILLNSIDADMKSETGSSWGGLWPFPLRFHFGEAGADAKLIQHGPLGVAYHRRHPISTIPVARITAHATMPGLTILKCLLLFQIFLFWKEINAKCF